MLLADFFEHPASAPPQYEKTYWNEWEVVFRRFAEAISGAKAPENRHIVKGVLDFGKIR